VSTMALDISRYPFGEQLKEFIESR